MKKHKQEKKPALTNDDLEAQIQDEIRRRILEKEQALQEEKQRDLQTQATLEALEEMTGVPAEEAQEIARQVRMEYTARHNYHIAQKQAKRTAYRVGLVVAGILLLIIGGVWYQSYRRTARISYTALFTTGLNAFNEPVNTLHEISLGVDRIYLYVAWQHLPRGTHTSRLRIFDGTNSLAWEYTLEFSTNEERYNTWFWYHPKDTMDTPGQWRFEIFLDGKKMFEKSLSVVSRKSNKVSKYTRNTLTTNKL